MAFDLSALGDKLHDVVDKIKDAFDGGDISLDKLFSPEFMQKHTAFKSFTDFVQKSGLKLGSMDDVKNVSAEKLDSFVAANTKFSSFKDMLAKATEFFKGGEKDDAAEKK